MNGFFDYFGNDERGKCETNFFHIYINDDMNTSDISQLDVKTKGTFMHEYLHYFQFINTIFGISYGIVYNNYFSCCRKYFEENQIIDIPLNIKEEYPILKENCDLYSNLKGSSTNVSVAVLRIEVETEEINRAKENHKGVSINIVESDTNKSYPFEFGYLCIIESMAHIFQSFFDVKIEHPQFPYKAVQLICKDYLPGFVIDEKMMFSICFCSLMYDNPAVGFFEILNIVRLNPRLNGLSLYRHMVEESRVYCAGVQKSIQLLFFEKIAKYQNQIESAVNMNLEYYSLVFENCRQDMENKECLMLKLLYEEDITSKKSIDCLLNFYGLPFVESNTFTFLPKLPNKGIKYPDIAFLRALEMVIDRFIPFIDKSKYPVYNPQCPLYDRCIKSLYLDGKRFEMTEDCRNKQWRKKSVCLMTESLQCYHIDSGKTINQFFLPPDMQ